MATVEDQIASLTARVETLEGFFPNGVNAGDNAFVLISAALVCLMTPALGMFYGGLCNAENVLNTIMMSFVTMGLVTLQWLFVGYSFAFGPGNNAFGSFQWGGLVKVSHMDPVPQYMPTVPHLSFTSFQVMFAQITPALISGSVVGRMKFSSYLIFVLIWTTACYDLIAHFVWSWTVDDTGAVVCLGWLCTLGAIDFAGGTVIHITSGFSGLVAAMILGQRRNADAMSPHNQPMVVTGAALLWFGWFGFNGGNLYMADSVAVYAAVNTQIAICGSCIVWMILERLYEGKTHASQFAIAAVVGMICSTPSSGYVEPWTEIIIGGIGGLCSFYAVRLRQRFFFDDTLDVFSAHGVGGMVGPILTGCFATKSVNPAGNNGLFYGNAQQLGVQILAVVVITALSMSVTAALLYGLKYTMGLRVSAATEERGLDSHVHGELAYLIETTDQKTGLKEVRVVPPVQVEHLVGGSLNGRIDPDGSIRNGNGSVSQHRIVGVLPSFKPLHPTLHTTGVATAVSLSGAATLEKLVTLDV